MKEDQQHHQAQPIPERKLPTFMSNSRLNLTLCILLLLLSYVLGYYSASYNFNSSLISNTHLTAVPTPPTCPDITPHTRFGPNCSTPVQPDQVRQKLLDRIFNGTSPYDNFPPAHLSELLQPNRVKGWGSYGAVFENLVRKVKPRTIIEVGTFLGASAIHMADLTRKLGLETQILCLDDFRGWPGFRDKINYTPMVNGDVLLLPQFLQNVMHSNATGSVMPVPFSTGSGLDTLCEWGVMADLIEVDAGHDFHSAWDDINRAHKLLRPGGVLFGHDYFTAADNRGVRRAVDLFARINGFRVKVDGQHWVIDFS